MTGTGWDRIRARLQEQGPAWIWRRLSHEWQRPSTPVGKALIKARLRMQALASGGSHGDMHPDADSTLFAFYDLAVEPITFDAPWLMISAERRRRALGLPNLAFIIVPGREGGVRTEDAAYESVVDAGARRTRLTNILYPLFALLPSVASSSLLGSRAAADDLRRRVRHVHPPLYDPALPMGYDRRELLDAARQGERLGWLQAPQDTRAHIGRWRERMVGARRLVTITLRQYDYMESRNSDIAAWAQFARSLDPATYAVCIVPDTAQSSFPLPQELAGFLSLPEAAWNVVLRMALYEAAFINLGINTGPLTLPIFAQGMRFMMFKIMHENAPQTTEVFLRRLGYAPGEQPPVLGPGQRWVWEPDTFPVIAREFAAMVREIDAGRA